ncbi:hypothetical protein EJ05DRAFT_324217 [Pseudovirgaria hyperparasitica]|uniref:YMC020W-like alpha/beta hydrolase domain-containing protein n=1 Tax=Pseudovirgaria hyperparasitica TaxID=470096 RepID=A0A6A6W7I7_9PEZI|nr:uncharacterized protein EJ05DRAFT_324217 [Pseudovirgaria hyperparasitica]KAF2758858.1 hypothetical protein EJ05DRAFT_324217 [Pseudovirgaria hyperparasitica]
MTKSSSAAVSTPASPPPSVKQRLSNLKRLGEYLPMGPSKKSKLNDKAPASEPQLTRDAQPAQSASSKPSPASCSSTSLESILPRSSTTSTKESVSTQKSWYGGSWRSKASPVVAQVARENVGALGGPNQELPKESNRSASGSPATLLSKRRPSKGNPIAASMTKVHVTSNGDDDGIPVSSTNSGAPSKDTMEEPPLPPDPTVTEEKEDTIVAENTNRYSTGMSMLTSWWSRPDGYETVKARPVESIEAQRIPLPGNTPVGESEAEDKDLKTQEPTDSEHATVATEGQASSDVVASEKSQQQQQQQQNRSSWFWLWSRSQSIHHDGEVQPEIVRSKDVTKDGSKITGSAQAAVVEQQSIQTPLEPESLTKQVQADTPKGPSTKSTGWAFWSRENPKAKDDTDSVHREVGEIAVADTPSQNHPEAAQFNEREEPRSQEHTPAKARPHGKDSVKKSATSSTPSITNRGMKPKPIEDSDTAVQPPLKVEQCTNFVLPDFRSTYQFAQSPSVWQQIRRYLLGDQEETPHIKLLPSPPRVKKALAVGIHGYFPTSLIRSMIGQPTGTSIRFANCAANAISEWTHHHGGYSCEIEKVALEGEGFIADRVDTLWKLLLNWIEHVRNADLIMVACHSQGVPVAIMLIAKLISFGCISPMARIGVCAMAGINLGPFVEYRTRYLGSTAAELFEFSNPKSTQSANYMNAMQEVLKFGVKLVYVGSLDDQLVSLESSTFANISHPYIYRAVFVNGKLHAPDFMTHLVGFVLKLRNLGLPDHGLIHELSPALAGSLYSGEGHSRIHEDSSVYSLAVSHILETTNIPHTVPLIIKDFQGSTSSINPNPYFLPWAMRGLLEEEFVRRELGKEVDELLSMFEAWKPTSKALKDVKFRLEAVRSRL